MMSVTIIMIALLFLSAVCLFESVSILHKWFMGVWIFMIVLFSFFLWVNVLMAVPAQDKDWSNQCIYDVMYTYGPTVSSRWKEGLKEKEVMRFIEDTTRNSIQDWDAHHFDVIRKCG